MALRAITFSTGIERIPCLGSLLGVDSITRKNRFSQFAGNASDSHCIIGWGRKKNTTYPRSYAARHGLPYLSLEDGFLRSIGLGVNGHPPLSIVIDDVGIYYDARHPSRLEMILNGESATVNKSLPPSSEWPYGNDINDRLEDAAFLARARDCIDSITRAGLSKYNSSPDIELPSTDKPRVLVVDQTAGDLSIECGLANAESFDRMLATALAEHPQAEILLKVHPDVVAGKKQGHLQAAAGNPRIRLLDVDCNPVSLIRQVEHVYVVTSLTGFEALMLDKPVTCFGAPFYAGWGLTDDRVSLPRRVRRRSLAQVFAAAYLLYARYRDPESGEACEIERVIEHLVLQRHWFRENAGELYCYGFSLWKRGFVGSYLRSPWNTIHFVRSARQIPVHGRGDAARLVVWGRKEPEAIRELSKNDGIPLWRIEDGFLRSVGLGSDLAVPASLVVDKQGIYFDPSCPSDLEAVLQNRVFTDDELSRARALQKAIVSLGLSKYNVGRSLPLAHFAKPGQQIILVPGQVEDDASIRLGCSDIRTNAQLLRAVREAAPHAYIIYKPHPDVLSRNRGRAAEPENQQDYQQLITDISISQCLDQVDEVHTMTSLAGFEGLLRGKRVVTYGMPFYAGWGLTEDRLRCERRSRALSLDELLVGCLLIYPRYLYNSASFTTPEIIIRQLQQRRSGVNSETQIKSTRFIRAARKLVNLLNGIFYAR